MMLGSKGILPLIDTRIALLLCNSRNSTHIRNPLIFQEKSLLPHVCAGQQFRILILQAGTNSDLLTLVSYDTIIQTFVRKVNGKIKKAAKIRYRLSALERCTYCITALRSTQARDINVVSYTYLVGIVHTVSCITGYIKSDFWTF